MLEPETIETRPDLIAPLLRWAGWGNEVAPLLGAAPQAKGSRDPETIRSWASLPNAADLVAGVWLDSESQFVPIDEVKAVASPKSGRLYSPRRLIVRAVQAPAPEKPQKPEPAPKAPPKRTAPRGADRAEEAAALVDAMDSDRMGPWVDKALKAAAAGVKVLPLDPKTQRPLVEIEHADTDENIIAIWGEKYPEAATGVVWGAKAYPLDRVHIIFPKKPGDRYGVRPFTREEIAAQERRERFRDLPDLARLLSDNALTRPEPLVGDGIIRRGDFAILAGEAYSGKTWLLLDLAVALASGGSWIEFACQKARVGIVPRELSAWDLRDRLTRIVTRRGIEDAATLPIFPCVHPYISGRVVLEHDVDGIADWIKEREIEAVIIDPLARVMDGSDKDDKELKPALNAVDDLRERTGATIIIAHHFKKPTGHDQGLLNAIRGHTLLSTNPTVNLALEVKTDKMRKMSFWMNNAEAPDPAWLQPLDGGGFARTEAPTTRMEVKRGNKAKIVELVRNTPGISYEELATATGVTRRTVERYLEELITTGEIPPGERRPDGRTGFQLHLDTPE